MPLYDFRCLSCGFEFEDLLKISDSNPKCPECNLDTQKLISRFSGVVTGSEHRSLDCIVGADAEKRWQAIEKRKVDRRNNVIQKRTIKDKD